jgi:hypothetical protein
VEETEINYTHLKNIYQSIESRASESCDDVVKLCGEVRAKEHN